MYRGSLRFFENIPRQSDHCVFEYIPRPSDLYRGAWRVTIQIGDHPMVRSSLDLIWTVSFSMEASSTLLLPSAQAPAWWFVVPEVPETPVLPPRSR